MSDKNHTEHAFKFAVLATDTAIFTLRDDQLLVRTIRVQRPPHFPDNRGLPGGLIHPKENAEDAVAREIKEKAFLDPKKMYIEQLATFSDVNRDPRGRVVAVAYLALVPWEYLSSEEQVESNGAAWVPLSKAKKLAYDHDEILAIAIKRLRSRIVYTTLISKMMPHEFTLTELENAYGQVLKATIDKRNFRKKILKLKIVSPTVKKRGGAFRPAQLYHFTSAKVDEIKIL